MQYGVCASPAEADHLAQAGFDFIEGHVQTQLQPEAGEEAFAEPLAAIQASALPCPVANCFVPGGLPITGPDADSGALQAYVQSVFERAKRAGMEVIVFGSGGARQIPDGFDRGEAWKQLRAFGTMAGTEAAKQDIMIAVEPLNQEACNVLTSVAESASYVREVDHPHVRLLVDSFHWAKDDRDIDAIVQAGPILTHVHVATDPARLAPGAENYDFKPFFKALHDGGYDGRVSIEGTWAEGKPEAVQALETLKAAAG